MSRILVLSARKAINPEVKSCIYQSKRQYASKHVHSVVLSPVFDTRHASMSELLSIIIVSNFYTDIDQNNTRYPTGTLRHAVSDHVCTCSADMEGCLPAQSVFFKVDIASHLTLDTCLHHDAAGHGGSEPAFMEKRGVS